jgi:hypothetical protein
LTHKAADMLRLADSRNGEVVFPLITGQEINNTPDQRPGRSIINFHDWSLELAATYHAPFEIVERLVKPERQSSNRAVRRDRWWQYAERAAGLNSAIRPLARCFVAAVVTKYLNFSYAPTDAVFTHKLYVFATDRWDLYTVVQSSLHEAWARKYSGTLGQTLNYSPTDCFVTFAFPDILWQDQLASIGERYHEHRKSLMLSLWLGLTDIYNLFHARPVAGDGCEGQQEIRGRSCSRL